MDTRTYEVVFIASPNTGDEDVKKLTSQLETTITDRGGKLTKTEEWGRRKLAYRIGKFDEGNYTLLYIEGTGQEIAEVERRLRVTDFVIRHQTVRTDEDLKRAAKMKAKRKNAAAATPRNANEDFSLDGEDEDDDLDM
jgi:small subunit ribosomal protein S6